ncbi:MAG: tetratricopeptide repeat protein [Desulfobacterales bacterium]
MKIFCDYHPTKPAHWNCEKCAANLCPACVTQRDQEGYVKGQKLHLCPKCYLPVEWIGVGNLIDPFWKRLPKIFAYGFYARPLVLVTIIAVVSAFFTNPGIFSLVVRGLLGIMLLKYSFESLKATASGNLKPPKVNAETVTSDIGPVLKQGVMFILIGFGFGFLFATFGPFIAYPYLYFIGLLIPSMIIILVSSGSLLNALNPLAVGSIAIRIGAGYLLVYLFFSILGSAPTVLGHYLIQHFPEALHVPMMTFAQGFYTIVTYHLLGYVILQYHEEVGYQVDQEDFRDPSEKAIEQGPADPDAQVLNAVNPLIQEGKLDEAIALIVEMTTVVGIRGVNLAERYYTLLKIKKKIPEMLKHAELFLELLAIQNNKNKALKVYIECKKIKPDFLPDANALFKLAGWLNEMGKSKEAIATYNRLVKEYPEHKMVPKAFFRVAQIFQDRLMSPDNARKILSGVKKKYPDHEIIPHVDNFLANIG